MYKFFAVIILSICLNTLSAQVNDSISSQLTNELKQINSQGLINGFSVAIVNQEGILYNKGFGLADVANSKSYTTNTIQNIGSISKTFIGVALLKAQELGQLKLDDSINKYLPFKVVNPNFPQEIITIRHLATHTSTIKDPSRYYKNGYVLKDVNLSKSKMSKKARPANEMMPLGDFLKHILYQEGQWYKKSTFLNKKPGEHFEYSNIGAGLAAYILEQATGSSFTEFTKQHIFSPLKMENSGWSFETINFSNHTKLYEDIETEMAFYRLVNYPDGGLLTTSTDLANYLSELIRGYNAEGKVLEKSSYSELFREQLTESNFEERSQSTFNDEYNSGIFMGFSAKGFVGHTGSDPGIVSFMFFNPKTNLGKLLFINTELNKDSKKVFINIWKKLNEFESQFK